MNAQQEFAPSKPFEQRRIYEGDLTGPVPHVKNTMFLFSLNRAGRRPVRRGECPGRAYAG